MNDTLTVTVDRDSVSMGDDMSSHRRSLEVARGTALSELVALSAPDVTVPGWAWVALVAGRPRAVWSSDHGVMLLGDDAAVLGDDGAVRVHFRYVSGIDPFWLRERISDGVRVDWQALEAEYRPAGQAAREEEHRRLEAEDPRRLLTPECVAAIHSLGGVGDLHHARMFRFTLFGETWSVQRSDTMTLVYRGSGGPLASLRPTAFAESWLVAVVAAEWRLRQGLPPVPPFFAHPGPELAVDLDPSGIPRSWTAVGPLTAILHDETSRLCFQLAVGRSVSEVMAAMFPTPQDQAPSGARYWAWGLLWFVPVVGAIGAPVLLGVLASQQRRNAEPLLRENSRWAANWSLTVTLVAILGLALVAVDRLASVGAASDRITAFTLAGNLLLWASWIGHLIVSLFGVFAAGKRVFRPWAAIPFLRPAR